MPLGDTALNNEIFYLPFLNISSRVPTPERDISVPAICAYAADTGTVAIYMKHIPNQPFTFTLSLY